MTKRDSKWDGMTMKDVYVDRTELGLVGYLEDAEGYTVCALKRERVERRSMALLRSSDAEVDYVGVCPMCAVETAENAEVRAPTVPGSSVKVPAMQFTYITASLLRRYEEDRPFLTFLLSERQKPVSYLERPSTSRTGLSGNGSGHTDDELGLSVIRLDDIIGDVRIDKDSAGFAVCGLRGERASEHDLLLLHYEGPNAESGMVRTCVKCTFAVIESDKSLSEGTSYVCVSLAKLAEYKSRQNLLEFILRNKRLPEDYSGVADATGWL